MPSPPTRAVPPHAGEEPEPSDFRALLERLGDEHEREVSALRAENERLRLDLRGDKRDAAAGAGAPRVEDAQLQPEPQHDGERGAPAGFWLRGDKCDAGPGTPRMEDAQLQLQLQHDGDSRASLSRSGTGGSSSGGMSVKLTGEPFAEANGPQRGVSAATLALPSGSQSVANSQSMMNSQSMRNGRKLTPLAYADSSTRLSVGPSPHRPHSFTMKQVWMDSSRTSAHLGNISDLHPGLSSMTCVRRQATLSTSSITDTEPLRRLAACCRPKGIIISPSSNWHLCWDIMCLVFIGIDVVTIPLQAFNPPRTWLSEMLDYTTLAFWTCDMIQTFFLGYYHKGQVVLSLRQIVWHYLTTWFVVDFVVVVPDWIMTLSNDQGSAGIVGVGRILRGMRAIRVLRLLRLLKLRRIMGTMLECFESEYSFTIANLAKLLLSLFVLNHLIACGWYLIGKWGRPYGPNWLDDSETTGKDIEYLYFTSLHWSLTQFTPASMNVSATNVPERVYSILVLFFALVTFSSIVGTITTSMTHLQNLRGDEMKQFWLLRRYLKHHGINKDLTFRIMKYLEYQSARNQDCVQPGDIPILANLSGPLSNELMHQLTAPVLMEHPFFRRLSTEMVVVMHRLCAVALHQYCLAASDVIFEAGEEARRMYFVKNGDFEYTLMSGELLEPPVQPGDWVSEAVLWTRWRHLGSFRASLPSELIGVDSTHFAEEMCMYPGSWALARQYGEQYLHFLNGTSQGCLSDVLRSDEFYGELELDAVSLFGAGLEDWTLQPSVTSTC